MEETMQLVCFLLALNDTRGVSDTDYTQYMPVNHHLPKKRIWNSLYFLKV